jgi:hypothetical protein
VNIAGYVKVIALIVVGAALIAAAAPQDRSTVARVALFALVVTVTVGLVDLAHQRSPLPEASPFEPRAPRPTRPGLPVDVERFAVEVRAFSAAVADTPAALPPSLRRAIEAIVATRLTRRGLRLDDPGDRAACAEACGPELWNALDGQPVAVDAESLVRAVRRL